MPRKLVVALIAASMICLSAFSIPLAWNNAKAVYAQAVPTNSPQIMEWYTTFGLGYYNTAYQIIQTQDGGYVVAGMYGPQGSFLNSALVKYDTKGNLLWNQTYDMRFCNYPNLGLIQTKDGGYAIAGNRVGNIILTLIKTNSEGKTQWEKDYPDINCLTWQLASTNDGGYLIAGGTTDNHAVLVKVDVKGEMQWSKTYSSVGFRAVVQIDNDNFVAVGGEQIVEIDSQGNIIWKKAITPVLPNDPEQYRYSLNDMNMLVKTTDGYALLGRALNKNKNGSETMVPIIVKTDLSGTIQWNKTYGEQIWPYSLIQTIDKGYALSGTAANNMILIKTDEAGNELWNQSFGEPQTDETSFSLIQTSDGGFALAGKIKEIGIFSSGNFYVIKTAASTKPSSYSLNDSETHAILIITVIVITLVIVSLALWLLLKKYSKRSLRF